MSYYEIVLRNCGAQQNVFTSKNCPQFPSRMSIVVLNMKQVQEHIHSRTYIIVRTFYNKHITQHLTLTIMYKCPIQTLT